MKKFELVQKLYTPTLTLRYKIIYNSNMAQEYDNMAKSIFMQDK